MSLLSWAVARAVKLDKPLTGKVRVDRDLRVQMSDGVDLLADRYAPDGGDGLPVVLVRTPYGRKATAFRLFGEIFAQRGYQVVVQSCRGTFGSGGKWRPFQTDREDGLATIAWLRRQPWFGGKVGMFGPSYTGFVQWAIAADCPEEIGALSLVAAASRPRDMIYAGGRVRPADESGVDPSRRQPSQGRQRYARHDRSGSKAPQGVRAGSAGRGRPRCAR